MIADQPLTSTPTSSQASMQPARQPAWGRTVLGSAATVLTLALLPTLNVSAASKNSPLTAPEPYEARYEARSHGMSTEAYRNLIKTGDNVYQLSHGLSLKVLGANLITVTETSHFYWVEHGAVPVSYAFEQSGVRKRQETISFDWETGTAAINRNGNQSQTEIEQGLLDNLSFSTQMSAELAASAELSQTGTVLSYQILDGTEPEIHEYRVVGQETVETPAGSLETVSLQRVREADSDRTTTLWLAPAHDFVLAKLEQIEDGDRTELLLKSITAGDSAP